MKLEPVDTLEKSLTVFRANGDIEHYEAGTNMFTEAQLKAAILEEREACAMECTTLKVMDTTSYTPEGYAAVRKCAEAIRARKDEAIKG